MNTNSINYGEAPCVHPKKEFTCTKYSKVNIYLLIVFPRKKIVQNDIDNLG